MCDGLSVAQCFRQHVDEEWSPQNLTNQNIIHMQIARSTKFIFMLDEIPYSLTKLKETIREIWKVFMSSNPFPFEVWIPYW